MLAPTAEPTVDPSTRTAEVPQPGTLAAQAPTVTPPVTTSKWRNPYASIPTLRWASQIAWTLFLVAAAFEFYDFYLQSVAGGAVRAHRPQVVEAFLPIAALLSLKRFLYTGQWDDVHPAGLAILIAALVSAFVARRAFCSWVCPIGTLSRVLEVIGEKTIWRRRRRLTVVPGWLDNVLSGMKYALMVATVWFLAGMMSVGMIDAFMGAPYNYVADARMLLLFLFPSVTTLVVLGVLVVASFFIKNAWCRYLCPYGALLGTVSWLSPNRIVRDASTCNDCQMCTRKCPAEVQVHRKPTVISPECTGCLTCVSVCPVKDCLTVGRKAKKGWSPYWVPALCLAAILAVWGVARVTDHWTSKVPTTTFTRMYRQAQSIGH